MMTIESKRSYVPMRVVQVGSLANLTQATMMGTFFDCGNRTMTMMRMMMDSRMYPTCVNANGREDGDDE